MKLVCIGDSLTFGYGLHKADKWVTLLEEKLNNRNGGHPADMQGWEIINAGINGDTSGGALSRLKGAVIDQKPDMVLIMTGGNDYIAGCDISAVKANITAMTMQCAAAGIKVFVSSEIPAIPEQVAPEWKAVADFEEYNRKQKEIREWYPKYCRGFGYTYIDLFDKWCEATAVSSDYYQDGIHPNQGGNRVFAEIYYNEFRKFNS